MEWSVNIDAVGLKCPLPVLRLRKHLEDVPPGTTVRLLASDPMAVIDVPHFCAEAGHDFLGQEPVDGAVAFFLRRGA